MEEVLARSIEDGALTAFTSEEECERKWRDLQAALSQTMRLPAWVLRKLHASGHWLA